MDTLTTRVDNLLVKLDIESKEEGEKILKQIQNIYFYKIYNTGSRGGHISLFFKDLDKFEKRVRNKFRRLMILKYNCDLSKANEDTLIAVENKPHFKTMQLKNLIEEKNGENNIDEQLMSKLVYVDDINVLKDGKIDDLRLCR